MFCERRKVLATLVLIPALILSACAPSSCWGQVEGTGGESSDGTSAGVGSGQASGSNSEVTQTVLVGFLVVVVAVLVILGVRSDMGRNRRAEAAAPRYATGKSESDDSGWEIAYGVPAPAEGEEESPVQVTGLGLRTRF